MNRKTRNETIMEKDLRYLTRCVFLAIFRTGAIYEKISLDDQEGKSFSHGVFVSGLIPVCLTLFLATILNPGGMGGNALIFALFTAGSSFAAGLAIWLAGRLWGNRLSYGGSWIAWAQTYWATAAFLALLALSHLGVALFGSTPSELPLLAQYVFLGLYLSAGIWKLALVITALLVALGIRGWRLALAIPILLLAAFAYAILSALLFGTKVPIL